MNGQLLIFAGSLIAIFALAGLAIWLGLGRDPTLSDEGEAQRWADQVSDAFAAQHVALDLNGKGALLCDCEGNIMVLKPHGGHFTGRILGPSSSARIVESALAIDCGEARFGKVHLAISDPQPWADAINALECIHDA